MRRVVDGILRSYLPSFCPSYLLFSASLRPCVRTLCLRPGWIEPGSGGPRSPRSRQWQEGRHGGLSLRAPAGCGFLRRFHACTLLRGSTGIRH
jgi:hypothetical protein